jgi:hypothetical protein
VTDHGGTHCQPIACGTRADCPDGFDCLTREECWCDPRGEPCSCADAQRCLPAGSQAGGDEAGDDPPPGTSTNVADQPRSGCACRAAPPWDQAPVALSLFTLAVSIAVLARPRRR